ncbi:Por secretion system C-terminal sorting domain-containing protein [Flexibacter flexilis DSM 6793]|uniref:Por secretion system C-terminal sorting domain-containing protein n=1 Tax=Flexibacter flexilis DSM 6793 TaxID=927664 RepID=A0A1I1MP57_9BACT|nr:lamin tail domain-containing protein [Flexibacter flexilis]SFC87264.1 Por secretion system C-terminal sorting domain-containing protein [Flexibacter flexilis DSM 6793]
MFSQKLRNIFFGLLALLASAQTQAQVVISQVYGGGGSGGATYQNDYVELHNSGATTATLTNWAVQYASATGTSWTVGSFSGSIPAGGYFLIKLGNAGTGAALPSPDFTSTSININATTGKVALTNSTTALSGSNPVGGATIIDFVGFGTANSYETAVAPAPSVTTAIFRAANGCTDSNNNSSDFSTATPSPRNSLSTAVLCGGSNSIGASSTPSNVTLANCTDVQNITVTGVTSTGTFTSGNTYTAQLSDASGSFATPLATASVSSTSNTVPDITISVPAGTLTGTGYKVRVVSSNPAVTGTASAAFTITQNGACNSNTTDYFRSRQTGTWATASNWESSADGISWITATLAPTSAANTITIQSGHNISITAATSFDQLSVEGTLTLNANANTITIANGAGTDLTVNSGGIVEVAGSNVDNITFTGTVIVNTGGIVRYTSGGGSNIAQKLAGTSTNTKVVYADGGIFDWNTASQFSSNGITYFSTSNTSDIPVFRVSQNAGNVGAGNATVINGLLEVASTGSITLANSAAKTFRNGINNAGTLTQATSSGALLITGTTAYLTGTGTINLATAGMNSTATTLTLGANKTINNNGVTSNFTVSSGTFEMGTYGLAGDANFTLGAGATLKTAHANGIGAVAMTGTNTFTAGASYEFNGTSLQTINNPTGISAANFTVNNSAGAKLSNSITVANSALLTAGSLDLNSYNLDLSTTGLLSENRASNYLVVDNTSGLSQSNKGGYVRASSRSTDGTLTEVAGLGISLTDAGTVSIDRYHYAPTGSINKVYEITGTPSNSTMKIEFATTELGSLSASSNLHLYRYDGLSMWEDKGGVWTDAAVDYVTLTGVTAFSPWTVGDQSLLPVTLSRFSALRKNTDLIQLTWATASETHNKGFGIEQSFDGNIFQHIGFVEGAGNSRQTKEYSYTLRNSQAAYYRLRQTDNDGKISYTATRWVSGTKEPVNIYPNPAKGLFTFQVGNADANTEAHITNTLGQIVWQGVSGQIEASHWPKGVYFLHFNHQGEARTEKIIIE